MNEDDLARRVVARLDEDLERLPEDTTARLRDARRRAMQAHPLTDMPLHLRLASWIGRHRGLVGVALPALFVLVAAGAVFFLQTEQPQDPFDVEAALLADELPIHAYTDPGFDAWLQHTTHEEQQ